MVRPLFFIILLLTHVSIVSGQDDEEMSSFISENIDTSSDQSSDDTTSSEESSTQEETMSEPEPEPTPEPIEEPSVEPIPEVQKPRPTPAKPIFTQLKSDTKAKPVARDRGAEKISAATYVPQLAKYKLSSKYRPLLLKEAIEQGLRLNRDENIRKLSEKKVDLERLDNRDSFWLPTLELSLKTEKQLMRTLSSNGSPRTTPKSPDGTIALSFAEYTVFNWGKDYLSYLNKQDLVERELESFTEAKRELKQNIIYKYFELLITKKIEAIQKEQVQHASYIYRLSREKVQARKITRQDYYQSRTEYLYAQNEYEKAKLSAEVADREMAFLIGDPAPTRYYVREELSYKKISMELEELTRLAKESAPSLKEAHVSVNTTLRNYEIAVKDDLPLPKFTIGLGGYTQKFGQERSSFEYATSDEGKSIELVAAVNATWTVFGEDGFLNSRKRERAYFEKEIAHKRYDKTEEYLESSLRTAYDKVVHYQDQMTILTAQQETLKRRFDTTLKNFTSNNTTFIHFQSALRDWIAGRVQYEATKMEHLAEKIRLAKLVGIEDLKGESFEDLTVKLDKNINKDD